MRRFACSAILLLSPGLLVAAPTADAPSITGLWKIDGTLMGQPVRMMCAITDTNHKLSGVCSGAEDGYAVHKITGSVKAQKVEFYFQAVYGGSPLTLIVDGALNEDLTTMDGNIDMEPMSYGGLFSAKRELEHADSAQADAVAAQTDASAAQAWAAEAQAGLAAGNESAAKADTAQAGAEAAAAGAAEANLSAVQPLATGTWKIDGNVMGNPVTMTCVLTEADHKLAGTCTGSGRTQRSLTGTTTVKGVGWRFDDQFQGQSIAFSMNATMAADGTKMNGTMSVAPMGVDGTFVAVRQ
jgi:hypothetical protein